MLARTSDFVNKKSNEAVVWFSKPECSFGTVGEDEHGF